METLANSDGAAGGVPFGPDTGIIEGMLMGLDVPPMMSVTEWAGEYFVLSKDNSAEPGKFNPHRAAYQPGMLDAINEPGVKSVVMKCSAQVGKTSVLLILIGYIADRKPAPIMLVQATKDFAEAFSNEKLSPAIVDSPRMRKIFPDESKRKKGVKILNKRFPGGFIALAGANSPRTMRMRAIKYALADEVDDWDGNAGKEGDPLELLKKRTTTFWDSRMVMASTPLDKHRSRISRAYDESDQRKFMVPCPECDHCQVLEWKIQKGNDEGYKPSNVVWEKGKPETARYVCEECGSLLDDLQLKTAIRKGYWKAHKPFNGSAGFHIWELYSPWSSLPKVVEAYIKAIGFTDRLKTFVNTTLGEEWEGEIVGAVDLEKLKARREPFYTEQPTVTADPITGLQFDPYVVPRRAGAITAAVDVQYDRLELQVTAWGLNDERWLLEHSQLMGDPNSPNVWDRLTERLLRVYRHEAGHYNNLPIEAVAIDSGGAHTQKVYDYCARHLALNLYWWPIKGVSGAGKPIWHRSEISFKHGFKLILIGVDDAKLGIYSSLAVEESGLPNFFHLPATFTEEAIKRLTVERHVRILDPKGHPKSEWHKPDGARNEEFDCAVYNLAAWRSLAVNMDARIEYLNTPPKPKMSGEEIARLFA